MKDGEHDLRDNVFGRNEINVVAFPDVLELDVPFSKLLRR
jgi:hypothetical protein